MCLDQLTLEGFANYVMLNRNHSQSEKYKLMTVLVMFVVYLSELYFHDSFAWCFDTDFVSDGSKIPMNADLYDYYKDRGCELNDDDVPGDDEHTENTENNDEECDPE